MQILHCDGASGSAEATELLIGAADGHIYRLGMVQGEHTHKAFSVDLLCFVANQHIKGLDHGKIDKFPYLQGGADVDLKLMHREPPIEFL